MVLVFSSNLMKTKVMIRGADYGLDASLSRKCCMDIMLERENITKEVDMNRRGVVE